jgi:hypothetical protein
MRLGGAVEGSPVGASARLPTRKDCDGPPRLIPLRTPLLLAATVVALAASSMPAYAGGDECGGSAAPEADDSSLRLRLGGDDCPPAPAQPRPAPAQPAPAQPQPAPARPAPARPAPMVHKPAHPQIPRTTVNDRACICRAWSR